MAKSTEYSQEQIKEVISLYIKFGTYSEVGRTLGIAPTKVKQILNTGIKQKLTDKLTFDDLDYDEFYLRMFCAIWEKENGTKV